MIEFQHTIRFLQERIASLVAIYHYGSTAVGGARPDSDIDLAILADCPIPSDVLLFDFASQVASLLGREVDLVDLSRATPVLLMQVIQGNVLYCSDRRKLAEFETLAMSRYCRLNEERKDILRDIQARGTVYAR